MSKIRYSSEHEYIRLEAETATIGISIYAQEQLGDIVYVELPQIGADINKGDEVAIIESVKAASELYAPVSGTIIEINEKLDADPSLVNSDPEGEGWIFKIKLSNPNEFEELLDEAAYASLIA